MKIKTFEAQTEQEAIEKVQEELGSSAVILNIKKIKPRGIFSFLRKPRVEVIAASEDIGVFKEKVFSENSDSNIVKEKSDDIVKEFKLHEQEIKIQNLEHALTNTEDLLEKIISQLSVTIQSSHKQSARKYESTTVQLFYETLIGNGVDLSIAEELLQDLDNFFEDDATNINMIVKIVYNRIIDLLGTPEAIAIDGNDKPAIVIMVGPTGVGKTTTIAKLSSIYILNDNLNVGLITADTYRMAAVEQLKTYAEILGIDVEVVYTVEDLAESIAKIKYMNDIIFIDTAGRSHKNNENMAEIGTVLKKLPEAQKFLVLSATTQIEDLYKIIEKFSEHSDFKIIFTKLDEASSYGSILNVCAKTKVKLTYFTNGQNVPDDIKLAEPELIAKALLGSFDN